MYTSFTVYFDGKFWSGVFERSSHEGYSAAKTVFGAEPSDAELLDFIRYRFDSVVFSKPDREENYSGTEKPISPKRMILLIRDQMKEKGLSSKSHDAINRAFEEKKIERKTRRKEKREEALKRKFELKQMKKKEKKRGH
jgi:hypothetical protein